MVETKDSAALFLPSTEALSHGRTARRIGRVRSHKRSLRNQFHLFVNTREDFHSPGGIPPQDYLSLSLFHSAPALGPSISLLLNGSSNCRHCRRWSESSSREFANMSSIHPVPPPCFSPLKNNRTRNVSEGRRARPLSDLRKLTRGGLQEIRRSRLPLLLSFALSSRFSLRPSERVVSAGRAQGYNFIFRSLSALFCGLFTPPSVHASRFCPEERPISQSFAL